MIGKVLPFLRKRLDDYLRAELGGGVTAPGPDKVVFPEGDLLDPISFTKEAVSELLINVEEERLLRGPDLYARVGDDGRPMRQQPDLHLILHVLFVARFKQYATAWDHLAKVIEYLQTNRTFTRDAFPALPTGVDKLVCELATPDFAKQGDMWTMLKSAYHPSILYRVQVLVLHDVRPAVRDRITKPVVVHVDDAS